MGKAGEQSAREEKGVQEGKGYRREGVQRHGDGEGAERSTSGSAVSRRLCATLVIA